MTIISKLGTSHTTGPQPKGSDPSSPALAPTNSKHAAGTVPPSLTTTALSVPGSVDSSTIGLSENQLRRQGIECLVSVLKSLVTWGTGVSSGITSNLSTSEVALKSRTSEDGPRTPAEASERTPNFPLETMRQSTPDILDDPGRFESAKQKKTTLLEGIKKFNFKPKRVSLSGRPYINRFLNTFNRALIGFWKLVSFLRGPHRILRSSCSRPMV